MKTPTATFSGYLSMASARFNPPRLCPTSTTFSLGGREAKKSNKGSVYSYTVWTSWIAFMLMPEAAGSRAVTRWPADPSRGLSLYQLQGLWYTPCTRTKCFCTLGAAIFSLRAMRVLVKLYVAKIDKGHMENVTLVSWLNMMKAVGDKDGEVQ